jgi:nucleoside-diphosphate-sugar epimerase
MILVTGATGRLGQAVCRRLLQKGFKTRALVRKGAMTGFSQGRVSGWKAAKRLYELAPKVQDGFLAARESGWRVQGNEHLLQKGVEPFVGDVTDAKSLSGACKGVDTVIHLAASLDFMGGREKLFAINSTGTENIANAASDAGVKHFILASSISVYGKNIAGEKIDENSPTVPTTDYGASKLASEQSASNFSSRMRITALRIGVVYGPGFNDGYMAVFRMLKKGKMRILGAGGNIIPFVHADDVADAIMLAAGAKSCTPGMEIYNIVQNETLSQSQILKLAAEAVGAAPPTRHTDARLAWVAASAMAHGARLFGKRPKMQPEYVEILSSDRRISPARAQKKLGWTARVKLGDGINQMAGEFLKSEGIVK